MHTTIGARAGRREWLGLAVLALPTMVISIDITALFLALPRLSVELGADNVQQLWIMDIYGFLIAGFLITMGTLGDRVGRRRLLLAGATAFAAASVLAAYATSPELLILARAVLGIAGATLMPSTLALISSMFTDPGQRRTAIAGWATCMMGGAALGPVVGGVLLEHFWWGSIFLLGVPVMALLLATGPALLPEFRDPAAGRVDLMSVVLSLAAILPIVYGVKVVAAGDAVAVPAVIAFAGAVMGVVFVRRQRRLADPLVDLGLFGNRQFRAAAGIMLVGGAVLAGYTLMVSQYVQTVEGLSPLAAGVVLAPGAVAMAAGSMVAPTAARRHGATAAISAGLVVGALGFLLLSSADGAGSLPIVVAALVVIHIGAGPMFALGTDLVVGSAPPEKAGSAASLSETSNELGVALGLAIFGSIGAAVYRSGVEDVPAAVPSDAVVRAAEGVGAVASAGSDLPADVAAVLVETAHAAFTGGLRVVVLVGAVVFLALSTVAARALRQPGEKAQNAPRSGVATGVPRSCP